MNLSRDNKSQYLIMCRWALRALVPMRQKLISEHLEYYSNQEPILRLRPLLPNRKRKNFWAVGMILTLGNYLLAT